MDSAKLVNSGMSHDGRRENEEWRSQEIFSTHSLYLSEGFMHEFMMD